MGSTLPPDGRTVDAPALPSNVLPMRRPGPKLPELSLRLGRAAHDFASAALPELGLDDAELTKLVSEIFVMTVISAERSGDAMGLHWQGARREVRAALVCSEIVTEFKHQMQAHAADNDTTGTDDATWCGVLSHLALAFVGSGGSDV